MIIKYALKSLVHYWKLNVPIMLGVAISTAILVGALIVGDSVRFSLQQNVLQRLGNTSLTIATSERLFSQQLTRAISYETNSKTTPMLRTNGSAIINGGELEVNKIAVWGIDSSFTQLATEPTEINLNERQVAINQIFALNTGLKVGDQFSLKLNKLGTFPANTPFVSESESFITSQVTISKILNNNQLGNFNLQNIQSAPLNIFINIKLMNKLMNITDKANVMLLEKPMDIEKANDLIRKNWRIEDLNLKIRENKDLNYSELTTDRVFIDNNIENFCRTEIVTTEPVLTYFINNFSLRGKESPYSFISTDTSLHSNQIAINQWLADDLAAKIGDTIKVTYFVVLPLRKLETKDTTFVISQIYEPARERADPNLMPNIPGLTDAKNCRDWKSSVSVDLKKIRSKDEDYWKQFRGLPKAFVSLETAQKLWKNRFGQSTALRFSELPKEKIETKLLSGITPTNVGFMINNAKQSGLSAAANGTDFGGLFIGLSFFVLIASIILIFILFKLYLTFRKSELGTLLALGFTNNKIKKIFTSEALVVILLGIIFGIPTAIAYNFLILKAINTIWVDIIRTSIINTQLNFFTIATGSLAILIVSIISIWAIFNNFIKVEITNLQRKNSSNNRIKSKKRLLIGLFFISISIILLAIGGFRNGEINANHFYIAGFGVLPGLIFILSHCLQQVATQKIAKKLTMQSLVFKQIAIQRKRNILIISLLSIAIFLVVSTGLNRKDLITNSNLNSSGTGGYKYWVETTQPIVFDINSQKGKEEIDIFAGSDVVQFQVQQGEDASCLNLNKVQRPQLIACNPAHFNQRKSFSFATQTSYLDLQHPWLSLTKILPDGSIPAIADQTVIEWGVKKTIGDTLVYQSENGKQLILRLIGGLNNSVFQGNLIISDSIFNISFPSVSGSNILLIDSKQDNYTADLIKSSLRQWGADVTQTTDKLLSYYSVENTYLNIFLMLGAFGLLIGTVGLAIIIFRITIERKNEYALMVAIGFSKVRIIRTALFEILFLVATSVVLGIIPAFLSVLPTLILSVYYGLWVWLPIIIFGISLLGTVFCYLAVNMAFSKNIVATLRNE